MIINNFEVHPPSFALGYFISMIVSIIIIYISMRTKNRE